MDDVGRIGRGPQRGVAGRGSAAGWRARPGTATAGDVRVAGGLREVTEASSAVGHDGPVGGRSRLRPQTWSRWDGRGGDRFPPGVSSGARAARPRAQRDFTVPSGTPRIAAASATGSPCMSTSTSASRWPLRQLGEGPADVDAQFGPRPRRGGSAGSCRSGTVGRACAPADPVEAGVDDDPVQPGGDGRVAAEALRGPRYAESSASWTASAASSRSPRSAARPPRAGPGAVGPARRRRPRRPRRARRRQLGVGGRSDASVVTRQPVTSSTRPGSRR